MGDRELKEYLQKHLTQETEPEKNQDDLENFNNVKKFHNIKLEETVKMCVEIVREQKLTQNKTELRTGFIQYLSDVFRFEGVPILGLQAVTLLIICLIICTTADIPKYMPVFMPLFVIAMMPVMFKCQYYGMSEIEAATRASGAQIVLAKLVLAGAANLVCMTALISFEVHIQNSYGEIRQVILYCLVPYLACMVSMLRLIRLCKRDSMQICFALMLGFCACFGFLAKFLPWLYETSAFGLWIVAFLFFAAFFIKEIYFIISMRKEGKIYGIIS